LKIKPYAIFKPFESKGGTITGWLVITKKIQEHFKNILISYSRTITYNLKLQTTIFQASTKSYYLSEHTQIKQPCAAAKSAIKMVYKCHTGTC